MAEPNTSGISVAALFIALLGPLAGQYSLIVMSALAGALWPLSTMGSSTRREGALFLLRVVVTAVFVTGSAAWFLQDSFGLPIFEGLAVVSFAIGALGNGWRQVFKGLARGLASMLRSIAGGRDNGFGGRDDDYRP